MNPNLLGEYNVPRYLASFNKRIEPLLVVFHPDIRDEILVENPNDRKFFTKTQSQLVRGYPRRDGDQDTLDEVLTLSETEVEFWNNVNIDPFYMYLSGTLDLVNTEYVNKNQKIMAGFEKPIERSKNWVEFYEYTDDIFAAQYMN
jgi:hypothetical protein